MKNPIKQMIQDKKEYKAMMKRVDLLPEDYQFVYKQIQAYMWNFSAGMGTDMLNIHYELIDLFESGVQNKQNVLDVTGEDVAAFADALLENAKTYTDAWKKKLNDNVNKKLGGK